MFCNHCGKQLPDDSVYCSFCGKKLPTLHEATTPPELEETTPSEPVLLHTLEGHSRQVLHITFSPKGQLLGSGSWDTTVKLWDVQTGECLRTLGHNNLVDRMIFSPDSKLLASCAGKIVYLWDVQTGKRLQMLEAFHKSADSVQFSLDSKILVGIGIDRKRGAPPSGAIYRDADDYGALKLWNVQTGALLRELRGYGDLEDSVAFSPRGSMLAGVSDDNTVKLWDAQTGRCFKALPLEGNYNFQTERTLITFSPDGTMLACWPYRETMTLWNTKTGSLLRELTGRRASWVTFSPDSKVLVTSSDKISELWDIQTGECLLTLGDSDWWPIAFSPDGRRLASGNWDEANVRLWDMRSRECLLTLETSGERVGSVTFSPDGSLLASGGHDGTVRVWRI